MKRGLLALLALTLGCVLCAHAQPQWPIENHYKVYNIDPMPVFSGAIQLEDQFDGYFVDVLILEKFANPVVKNDEEIIFPDTHHTWWSVDLPGLTRNIEVINQFGDAVWQVENPQYLVLPARKYEPGPPLQNNHYLAYQAYGPIVGVPVSLVDQFGAVSVVVLEPLYFLNPVQKIADGVLYPIIDSDAHLACYRIDPPMAYQIAVLAHDQFGVWDFQVLDHDCLCVPSWKIPVVATEQRTWSDIKGLYRN